MLPGWHLRFGLAGVSEAMLNRKLAELAVDGGLAFGCWTVLVFRRYDRVLSVSSLLLIAARLPETQNQVSNPKRSTESPGNRPKAPSPQGIQA